MTEQLTHTHTHTHTDFEPDFKNNGKLLKVFKQSGDKVKYILLKDQLCGL